jgi:hypothetical protein
MGSMSLSGNNNRLIAENISFTARGNKEEFKRKLKSMKEMYTIQIPKVILSGIDWWGLGNGESFVASDLTVSNGKFDIYLDRSLPDRKVKVNNFPHQILMRAPFPISVGKIKLEHANLSYSEFNPAINKTGTVYVDDIFAEGKNIF